MHENIDNPFNVKDYRKWYAGTTFIEISSSLYIAASFLLLSITNDAKMTGIVIGAMGALGIFSGIFGGGFADLLNRKKLLINLIIVASLSNIFIFTLSILNDRFQNSLIIYLIIFFLLLESMCLHASGPAQDSSLKKIISHLAYPKAMSAAQARSSLFSIIGGPLAGMIYAVSSSLPFLIRFLCQLTFVFFFKSIKKDLGPKSENPAFLKSDKRTQYFKNITYRALSGYKESLKFIRKEKSIKRFIMAAPLVNFMVVLFTTWSIFYLKDQGYHTSTIGMVSAGFAIGGIIGSAITPYLASRVAPGWLAILGLSTMTAVFIVYALYARTPHTMFPLAIVAMIPSPPLNAGIFTYVFMTTQENMQGRIIALFQSVAGLSLIFGPIFAGMSSQEFEMKIILLSSCLIAILGILILVSSKEIRTIGKL